jgi:hypothetical protein
VLALVAMFGVWVEYRTGLRQDPRDRAAAAVLGLKLMETRTHRDAAAVVFLCYFLLITNFCTRRESPRRW